MFWRNLHFHISNQFVILKIGINDERVFLVPTNGENNYVRHLYGKSNNAIFCNLRIILAKQNKL